MKILLTTAVLAAVLSTGAFAQGTDSEEKQAAPSGQTKATTQDKGSAQGMSGSKASGTSMNKADQTSGAGTSKDSAGSKNAPGDKTGVSGGARN
jgi:hypothetical protein